MNSYFGNIARTTESLEQLKTDLSAAATYTDQAIKFNKLKHIAEASVTLKEWDIAYKAIAGIADQDARNALIAELIEEFLLPSNEISRAKELVKYLTPQPETTPILLIRIALAERNTEQALQFVDQLPTPQSRNFAFWHIVEAYRLDNEKEKAIEVGDRMLENARTIYNNEQRSFALRDVAKNLFLAHGDKERARKAAHLIPDEALRINLLTVIESA